MRNLFYRYTMAWAPMAACLLFVAMAPPRFQLLTLAGGSPAEVATQIGTAAHRPAQSTGAPGAASRQRAEVYTFPEGRLTALFCEDQAVSFRVTLNAAAATPAEVLAVAGLEGSRLQGLGLVRTEEARGHHVWRRQVDAPGATEGAALGTARGLRLALERVLVAQTRKGWTQLVVDFSSSC